MAIRRAWSTPEEPCPPLPPLHRAPSRVPALPLPGYKIRSDDGDLCTVNPHHAHPVVGEKLTPEHGQGQAAELLRTTGRRSGGVDGHRQTNRGPAPGASHDVGSRAELSEDLRLFGAADRPLGGLCDHADDRTTGADSTEYQAVLHEQRLSCARPGSTASPWTPPGKETAKSPGPPPAPRESQRPQQGLA